MNEVRLKVTEKQRFMIQDLADIDEVFYGGQAGGGKSEGLLMFGLHRRLACPGSAGLMLRRTFPELEKSLIRKSQKYYSPFAKYSGDQKLWRFPNGGLVEFGYCAQEKDVYQYQSAEYDDICFDEASHFTEFQITYMMSRLRPASQVRYKTLLRLASNPGNVGHHFLKARYVDIAREKVHAEHYEDLGVTKTRYFLPAALGDNTLMTHQEKAEYQAWLRNLPEHERKMLEEGDWDYVPGAAFSEISRDVHMIDVAKPDLIPERVHRLFDFDVMAPRKGINVYRSFDWGFSRPFSVGYWLSDHDNRLYRWAEIYGCKGANEGIQLPTRDIAKRIKEFELEKDIKPVLCIADASIWDKPKDTKGKGEILPSDAEIMADEGVHFNQFISKMVKAPHSRIGGVGQMHDRLRVDEDGLPNIFAFSTCVHWWRTVPVLPCDELNPEDVDTEAEDHAWDDTKMLLLARPFKSRDKKPAIPPMSAEGIWRRHGNSSPYKEQHR